MSAAHNPFRNLATTEWRKGKTGLGKFSFMHLVALLTITVTKLHWDLVKGCCITDTKATHHSCYSATNSSHFSYQLYSAAFRVKEIFSV